MWRRIVVAAAAVAVAALAGPADVARAQADPSQLPPGHPRSVPEETRPGVPPLGSDGRSEVDRTLSERLDRTDGVLKPPSGIDPGIHVPAPVPNPGTTPVIPPPGSFGSPSGVQPR